MEGAELGSHPLVRMAYLVVVTGALLVGASRGEAEEPKPLRWGADEEGGAPYISKDPQTGKYVGFEVDLAAALAKELGRPIKYEPRNFKTLFDDLERGDVIDFAMNGLEVTPDRARLFRLSRPYYAYRLQLVTRKDEDRFANLDKLAGRKDVTVATLENTAAARLLKKLDIPLKTYDDQVNPYEDLALKRVDAVLLDLPIAIYVVQKNADLNTKLKFAGDPIDKGYYAIVFRKQDEVLAQQFDEALDRLERSGELKRICEKWELWNGDQKNLKESLGDEPSTGGGLSSFFLDLLFSAGFTVGISVLSMGIAILLGLMVALSRLYGPTPLRWLALAYVEFFRGIPILLLLLTIYYVLPRLAENSSWFWFPTLNGFQAAVLGFGLNYAAYEAEIYRAGISSIPIGQWEAAASLGMEPALTFRRIILPQALRIILPPMTSDFVALFKDTSVASVIAVYELTKRYQVLSNDPANRSHIIEIMVLTALLYLIMSVPLGYLSRSLEKRWGRGHV
jgi:polar amino acid transport system substrate-binding protein